MKWVYFGWSVVDAALAFDAFTHSLWGWMILWATLSLVWGGIYLLKIETKGATK